MPSSSRVTSPEPGSVEQDHTVASDWSAALKGRFVPFLSHITEGCTILDINPSCCIPMFLSRGKSENAVKRLAALLNGDGNENQKKYGLTGMVSGTPTSVVVPLVGNLSFVLDNYLSDKYDDDEDITFHRNTHSEWYGIIDGSHYHCALMELCVKYPTRWNGVKWKVFCVRAGLETSEYRKLAIVQNERNKQMYHYESTLFDTLHTLRSIYEDLYDERLKASRRGARGVSIHHRDVAHKYDGGDHTRNTTVRQAVSVATRLSMKTINAIGEVLNMNCADIILNSSKLNSDNLTSSSSVMEQYDCRLFRTFLCTSTLRGAKNFMNAVKEGDEDAQVNCIYRARHWSEENEYRSIKPTELNKQFFLSKLALEEERKFLAFIEQDEWPNNMETIHENLLHTITYDHELDENKGNSIDILPVLWSSFKRLYPGRAKGLEERMNYGDQSDPSDKNNPDDDENGELPENPEPSTTSNEDSEVSEEERKRLEEEEAKSQEIERQRKLRMIADEHLSNISINTYELCFEDFKKEVWSSNHSRVDLVLSAIPSNTSDNSFVDKLPSFCKSVLKTGSYVFLILNESRFYPYHQAFTCAGFKVCEHCIPIIYETPTVKRSKSNDFPPRHSDIALIAKTQGRHPSGFKPEFFNESTNNEASHPVFGSILNVEPCDDKLKRPKQNSAIFQDERSVKLFTRIINLFSPNDGTVLDPFCGPLTTSLACLQTERSCIAMDSSGDAFRYAKSRLRIYATPQATMEDLETYCDPVDITPDIEITPLSGAITQTVSERRAPETSESPSPKRRKTAAHKPNSNYSQGSADLECTDEDVIIEDQPATASPYPSPKTPPIEDQPATAPLHPSPTTTPRPSSVAPVSNAKRNSIHYI